MRKNDKLLTSVIMLGILSIIVVFGGSHLKSVIDSTTIKELEALAALYSGEVEMTRIAIGEEEYIVYGDDSILRFSNLSPVEGNEILCMVEVFEMYKYKQRRELQPVLKIKAEMEIEEGHLLPGAISLIPCHEGFNIHEVEIAEMVSSKENGLIGTLKATWSNRRNSRAGYKKIQIAFLPNDNSLNDKDIEITVLKPE